MNLFNKFFIRSKISNPSNHSNKEWLEEIEKSYPSGTNRENFFLPSFPDEILQKNTVGCHGITAIQQAFTFYQNAVQGLRKSEGTDKSKKILDFGTGWGRISRFFIKDVGIDNIYGVDVEESFINICRKTFKTDNFTVISSAPPTTFPDATFDLITLYSVFSHLNEETCKNWVIEFHRILKPGGSIAFTTRGINFFDYCEAKKGAENSYENALGELFTSFEEARNKYKNGDFVFSGIEGVGGGGSKNTSFYGESFIPEKYIETEYCGSGLFKKMKRFPPHGMVDQETFILYK